VTMWRRESVLGVAMLLVAVAGCSAPMGRVAVLAPQGTEMPVATRLQRVEGEACGAAAMAGGGAVPSLQAAVEKALAKAPGANALVDVEIGNVRGGVPLFYVTNCLTVKGTAVKLGR
jgi:hypothetical protein